MVRHQGLQLLLQKILLPRIQSSGRSTGLIQKEAEDLPNQEPALSIICLALETTPKRATKASETDPF